MSLVIADKSYAGEVASQFIVKSVVGNEIVSGGHAYVKDGIKKIYTIPRFTVGDVIQDRKATPDTPQGSALVDACTLEPQDYMLYDEFNPRDFEDHWYAAQLNKNLIDTRLPVTAESVIIQEYLKQHNKFLGKAVLQSDKTGGTKPFKYFNGIITRAKADILVPKVASPVVLTEANVGAAFKSTLAIVSPDVLYDPALKFFVSYKTAQLWENAQQNSTFKGVDNTQAGLNRYSGRTVVPLYGMPDNTILLGKGSADLSSNLWIGMNSTDDATVQFAKLQANSELYFIKMLMKVDANYGFAAELALYTL
jgi:hypothetical protein